MEVSLRKAEYSDCPILHSIQVRSFVELLQRYEDYESNPAAESLDQIQRRFEQPFSDYYLIMLADEPIGMLRVCDFGENCRLSPICILPEYQGKGYAQGAVRLMEKLYPNAGKWELDTIAQEAKLCYLYEKLGYRRTERVDHIKDGMDLVFYEKNIKNAT